MDLISIGNKNTIFRRNNYLSWNDYFMAIACLASKFGQQDTHKSYGACIVNKQNKIIGIGHQGVPKGFEYLSVRDSLDLVGSTSSVVHAELNSILNCTLNDQDGCSMYTSEYPCGDCAKAIIQCGIKHIFYASTGISIDDSTQAATTLFNLGKVKTTFLNSTVNIGDLVDDLMFYSKDTTNKEILDFDTFFMSVALLAAQRSKDPSTQVGACIVNVSNKIVGTGYNGMPNGIHDDLVPWTKEGPYLGTKYAYVVHAELNAILNCILTDQTNCSVYVTLFPCNECAKAIIQSGIKRIVYLSDKHSDKDTTKAAKLMFKIAGVKFEKYQA